MSDDALPEAYKDVLLGLSGKVGELRHELEKTRADRDRWAKRATKAEASLRRLRKKTKEPK